MVNYQNGKIYKIECNQTGKIYVGSTTKKTLAMRLAQHVYNFKNNIYCTSSEVLENGNYDIILIESVPCNNKDELFKKEREYIESIICVNKIIPSRTRKEYCEINKESIKLLQKQWQEENKEYKKEYSKIYNQTNKEELREKKKIYIENNKEKVFIRDKKYREDNNDKLNMLYNCDCGGKYRFKHKSTHEKTKKHLNYIANNIDE
jgi:hypothetical protein